MISWNNNVYNTLFISGDLIWGTSFMDTYEIPYDYTTDTTVACEYGGTSLWLT
jgi:hypothetical protein